MALVTVTATVPAGGARQGDKIDCVVSSIGSAKSLAGGRLFLTPLIGPDPRTRASTPSPKAPITLEDPTIPTTGRIHGGCRLEEDFFNVFTKDGKITLVLEKNHADFQVAQDVAELINSQMAVQASSSHAAGPGHQPGQHRGPHPAAVPRRPGVVRLPGARPADPGAADRRPGGDQRAGRQHRHQRRRGDRRRGRHAQEHRDRDGRHRAPQGRSSPSIRSSPMRRSSRPWSRPSTPSTCRPRTSSTSSRAWTATANCTPH